MRTRCSPRPSDVIARIVGTVSPLAKMAPLSNVTRTKSPLVVHHLKTGEHHLDLLKWGLAAHLGRKTRQTLSRSMRQCHSQP